MAKFKFLINCGGCPVLKKGYCKKVKQERHARRELCPEVWDKEVKRLAKIVKSSSTQVSAILIDGRSLNPRLAFEKAGINWDDHK